MSKILISIMTVALLAVGVGYFFWYADDSRQENPLVEPTPENSEEASGLRIGSNAIYVPDQLPGKEVVIGFVSLEAEGFVAVYEAVDEKPGTLVGSSGLLPAGETGNNIPPISLVREMVHGETFIAALYRDNGNGVFDPAQDAPITDEDGESFAMQFMIDRDAA